MNSNTTVRTVEGGDDEMPSVNEHSSSAAKRGLGYLFLLAVLVLGLGLAWFWFIKSRKAASDTPPSAQEQVTTSVPPRTFDSIPPPPPEAKQIPVTYGPLGSPSGQTYVQPGQLPPRPQLDKSASSLMVIESGGIGTGNTPGNMETGPDMMLPGMDGQPGNSGRSSLSDHLTGTATDMTSAGYLADRNMTVAKGAMIDCVLKTRLDTTVPGMSSCIVTRNIYSDNGKILLVERGSEVVGEYTTGVQQGRNRIFVLWTRIKTPNGVVISLDSPGTDSLGGAGLGGHVKYHFWRRFGAAMLLSVVDDAASYAANRNRNGGTTVNLGSTANAAGDMADTVLQQTIHIPPTLYKNQGDRINIFVARDLYFGDVYGLRTR